MTIKQLSIILFALSLFYLPQLKAQEEDAQLRLGASIGADFTKNFSWGAEVQQRFYDNISRYDQFLVEPSLSWDFANYLKLSAGYRLILKKDLEDGLQFKQRIALDLRAKFDVDYWSFKYRSRLQYGFEETIIPNAIDQQKLVNRNLAEVSYFIYGTRFTPYLGGEFYYYINAPGSAYITKYRIQCGTEIYINSKSDLTAYFIYEPEKNKKNPLTSYIYGIKYSFDL